MQEESGPDPRFEFSACETATCPFPVAVGAVKGAFAGAARPLVRPGAQLSRSGGRSSDRGAHGEVRLRGRGLRRRLVRASPASSRPRWAGARGAGLGRRLGTRLAPAALGVAGSVSLRLPGTGMTHLPTSIVSTSLQRLQSSHETPRTRRAPRAHFIPTAPPLVPRLRRAGGALPNPAGGGPSRHQRHVEPWLRRPRPLGGRRGPAGQKPGGWVSARLARRGLQASWSRLHSASRPWVRL